MPKFKVGEVAIYKNNFNIERICKIARVNNQLGNGHNRYNICVDIGDYYGLVGSVLECALKKITPTYCDVINQKVQWTSCEWMPEEMRK